MGNSSVKEAIEEAKVNRSLDLSRKLTPKQYVKVGDCSSVPREVHVQDPNKRILDVWFWLLPVISVIALVPSPSHVFFQHTSGEFIEGGLLALPWEMYGNTVTMYESVNASFNFISEVSKQMSRSL